MAEHITTATITHTDDQVPPVSVFKNAQDRGMASLAAWVEGFSAGRLRGTLEVRRGNGDAVAASGTVTLSGVGGTAASGTVQLAGGAGDVTITVNGTAVGPVPFNASDIQTATDCVTALNANATVGALITASNVAGTSAVITLTADAKGTAGNAITLSASRTAGTATASGATLAGGANNTVAVSINGVSISTNTTNLTDSAAAEAVKSAINASANALVAPYVTSTASALGVVTITAKTPGAAGNLITLSVSGTGALASGARLTGGTDSTAATVFTLTR